MKKAQIILMSILAACGYGVIHDQITVRLCIEYFTIAHPPLFRTTSPTALALCWGVAASGGIGLAFGVILALVTQSHGQVPVPVSKFARSILLLLALMAVSAVTAGFVGHQLAQQGLIAIPSDFAPLIPVYQRDNFMAVWFAHGASYLVGLGGAGLLCYRAWAARGRPAVISVFPRTRAAALRAALIGAVAVFVLWVRFGPH